MKATTQTSKDKVWKDESGTQIPFDRVTKGEKLRERLAAKLLKESLIINKKLKEIKEIFADTSKEVFDEFMESAKVKKITKGNFTWYNFDRTIRVEVAISERIEFDDLGINVCKEKLNQYISDNIQSKNELVTNLIKDAFQTRNGKLDTKKVMSLLRYKSRINDVLFQEAMNHLEESIRRPDSKSYYRIAVRNEAGQYDNVDLNFSSL
jgi:hypothetical protein